MQQKHTAILKGLSLWLLGNALPDSRALRRPARMALRAVVVAAAAGTLLALGLVAGLVAVYLYLNGLGLSTGASLGIVATMGVMVAAIVYLTARRQMDVIPDHLESLQLFRPHYKDALGDVVNSLLGNFLDGLARTSEKDVASPEERETLEDEIEAMLARLSALEADVDDVVLEIKPHAARKSRRKP